MINKRALNAYGSVSLDHQVETASPHRLVVMLFDGAIKSINLAKFHIQQGDIAQKGTAITKAISIVEEGLRLCLDKSSGGELAENLDALYEYASYQLLLANMKSDLGKLDEVLDLLNDLRESWLSIDPARANISAGSNAESSAMTDMLNFGR